jgi:hypothetical protein
MKFSGDAPAKILTAAAGECHRKGNAAGSAPAGHKISKSAAAKNTFSPNGLGRVFNFISGGTGLWPVVLVVRPKLLATSFAL